MNQNKVEHGKRGTHRPDLWAMRSKFTSVLNGEKKFVTGFVTDECYNYNKQEDPKALENFRKRQSIRRGGGKASGLRPTDYVGAAVEVSP